jgi:hypothetical protein
VDVDVDDAAAAVVDVDDGGAELAGAAAGFVPSPPQPDPTTMTTMATMAGPAHRLSMSGD